MITWKFALHNQHTHVWIDHVAFEYHLDLDLALSSLHLANISGMYLQSKITRNTLQWRHNESDDISNYQPRDRFLNRSFRRGPKKTSNLRVTGFCVGNSPVTDEFPAQRASNAEDVSIWWHHHATGGQRTFHGCQWFAFDNYGVLCSDMSIRPWSLRIASGE